MGLVTNVVIKGKDGFPMHKRTGLLGSGGSSAPQQQERNLPIRMHTHCTSPPDQQRMRTQFSTLWKISLGHTSPTPRFSTLWKIFPEQLNYAA